MAAVDVGDDGVHVLGGLAGGKTDDGIGLCEHLADDPPGGGYVKGVFVLAYGDFHIASSIPMIALLAAPSRPMVQGSRVVK